MHTLLLAAAVVSTAAHVLEKRAFLPPAAAFAATAGPYVPENTAPSGSAYIPGSAVPYVPELIASSGNVDQAYVPEALLSIPAQTVARVVPVAVPVTSTTVPVVPISIAGVPAAALLASSPVNQIGVNPQTVVLNPPLDQYVPTDPSAYVPLESVASSGTFSPIINRYNQPQLLNPTNINSPQQNYYAPLQSLTPVPPPNYNSPAQQSYAQQNQNYAQQQRYNSPSPPYYNPQQSYNSPQSYNSQQSYNSPQSYNPSQSYNAPLQSYNPPPRQRYNAPSSYNLPSPQNYNPAQSYTSSPQTYNSPRQSYSAPQSNQNYISQAPVQTYKQPQTYSQNLPAYQSQRPVVVGTGNGYRDIGDDEDCEDDEVVVENDEDCEDDIQQPSAYLAKPPRAPKSYSSNSPIAQAPIIPVSTAPYDDEEDCVDDEIPIPISGPRKLPVTYSKNLPYVAPSLPIIMPVAQNTPMNYGADNSYAEEDCEEDVIPLPVPLSIPALLPVPLPYQSVRPARNRAIPIETSENLPYSAPIIPEIQQPLSDLPSYKARKAPIGPLIPVSALPYSAAAPLDEPPILKSSTSPQIPLLDSPLSPPYSASLPKVPIIDTSMNLPYTAPLPAIPLVDTTSIPLPQPRTPSSIAIPGGYGGGNILSAGVAQNTSVFVSMVLSAMVWYL